MDFLLTDHSRTKTISELSLASVALSNQIRGFDLILRASKDFKGLTILRIFPRSMLLLR